MSKEHIHLGIMGFGHIGRQLFRLAMESNDITVVAVSDVADAATLHYLLKSDGDQELSCRLEDNYLINDKFKTRMLRCASPDLVPWDAFDVDMVVDCSGQFNTRDYMQAHLDNGAGRVLIGALPRDPIDRLVVPGINLEEAHIDDRMICAGSSTTGALAILLRALQPLGVNYATMTSVHSYTSDQSLQDYASTESRDYRRSRAATENIIPNVNYSPYWIGKLLPQLEGRVIGNALNVPVQKGSMLDCTLIFNDAAVGIEEVNQTMRDAAINQRNLLAFTDDPIVSSDVLGCQQSLLFDTKATIKAGHRMVKTISWYESLGHVARMMDVLRAYGALDRAGAKS
jgi:glyceraldehyde 3-phosphate dehydrogenase